jgi:hypothetical protein
MGSDGLSAAGWTIGDRVIINAKNRNSHGWRGTVDGFIEEVPGITRIVVEFEDRAGRRMSMTFGPTELVVSRV